MRYPHIKQLRMENLQCTSGKMFIFLSVWKIAYCAYKHNVLTLDQVIPLSGVSLINLGDHLSVLI